MANSKSTFATDDGVEISLEAKSVKIADKDVKYFYKIHGKYALGQKLTNSELDDVSKLLAEHEAKLVIKQGEQTIKLKLNPEEVQDLMSFLSLAFNEMIIRSQATFERIAQGNNLFTRLSSKEQNDINTELNGTDQSEPTPK